MKKSYLYTVIAIILLVGSAFGGYKLYRFIKYEYNKPHPDYVAMKPDLVIAAKRLWVDYSMNKDIADPKYTGKVIQVEGGIMNVEEADGRVIVVFAYKRGDFGDEGIRVTMLPEFSIAAKGINPFKPVKIKGLCTGYNGQDVIMENGSIVGQQ